MKFSLRWLATASLASLVVLMMLGSAWAQSRAIPVEARRSKIAPYNTSSLVVENQLVRMLPGVRIYNQENRTIRPGKIPQGVVARIRYNDNGDIREIWILTPEEIARKDPNPENTRRPGRSPIVAPNPVPVPAPEPPPIIVAPATTLP